MVQGVGDNSNSKSLNKYAMNNNSNERGKSRYDSINTDGIEDNQLLALNQ